MDDVPPRRTISILALVFAADLAVAMIVAAFLEPSFARTFLAIGLEDRLLRYLVLVTTLFLFFVVGQFEYTRRALLLAIDGRRADAETEPDLLERLECLTERAGVRTPRVVVAETPVPNCLALSGYRSGTVVLSTGLLAILSEEELEAVLAHELAHLDTWDSFTMTMSSFLPLFLSREYSPFEDDPSQREVTLTVFGVFLAWYLLSDPFLETSLLSLETILAFVLAMAVVLLLGTLALGLLATPIGLFRQHFSSRREFVADAHAAEMTSPDALASALEKLADATDAMAPQHDDLEALFILSHGFTGPRNDATGTTEAYTHPSIEERIDRLTRLEDKYEDE